jgi:hypothetical protein
MSVRRKPTKKDEPSIKSSGKDEPVVELAKNIVSLDETDIQDMLTTVISGEIDTIDDEKIERLFIGNETKDKVSCIGGTINPAVNKKFKGDVSEEEQIVALLRKCCMRETKDAKMECFVLFIIIQRELCNGNSAKKGSYHYHFYIHFKEPTRYKNLLETLKLSIDNWVGIETKQEEQRTTRVHTLKDNKGWVGYLHKEKGHVPSVYGEIPRLFNNLIRDGIKEYDEKRKSVETQYTIKEHKLHWKYEVEEYMKDKGYFINSITRQIMPDNDGFWWGIKKDINLIVRYGQTAHNTLQDWITNDTIHELPEKKLNRQYVFFKDGIYDLFKGVFEKDENFNDELYRKQKYAEIFPIDDLKDATFEEHCKVPELWLDCILFQGWDINKFKNDYSKVYKPPKRKSPNICVFGGSNCGKSTLFIPIQELLYSVQRSMTPDGNNTFSNLKNCDIVKDEEFMIENYLSHMSDLKQLLEGSEIEVIERYKGAFILKPKVIWFASNASLDHYKCKAITSTDYEAILNRLSSYEANRMRIRGTETLDEDVIDKIRSEYMKVAIFCTQSQEYIKQCDIEVKSAEIKTKYSFISEHMTKSDPTPHKYKFTPHETLIV